LKKSSLSLGLTWHPFYSTLAIGELAKSSITPLGGLTTLVKRIWKRGNLVVHDKLLDNDNRKKL